MNTVVRARLAPSPTGWLHVGNARTALFNFLFARRNKGILVLRIEDTDRERSRNEFEDDIQKQLAWLGIQWDEFYRQSERMELHTKQLTQLLNDKKAFYCAHTKEELETKHTQQVANKEIPRHVCSHRDEGRESGIIRFRNDVIGELLFEDSIRGRISFRAELLGDFSLARDISSPLYNFVVVVDDADMHITHIIRGEDHISNTPKQMLIQRALGVSMPLYAHLPLLLGSDKSKLSKRHGDTAVRDYREAGYLPEAVDNFLALLGWNPGTNQEMFTMNELIDIFSLEKVQKAGAVFNEEKLQWINRSYIQKLSPNECAAKLAPFVEKAGGDVSSEVLRRIAIVEQERISILSDIIGHVPLYTQQPAYDKELLPWKDQSYEEVKDRLTDVRNILCDISADEFTNIKQLQEALDPYTIIHTKGNVLWPLRAALSGKKESPSPFEIMYVIGKEETLRRLDYALSLLSEKANT
ncbi:MAG: glutamyl-tRNA synthetase [Parcubacteria group bacterium Gr01-1014_70]|nr:MAG: glutamyl-tRNA synthetase [Parcubacteria group bacterium Gr01-1014_70]